LLRPGGGQLEEELPDGGGELLDIGLEVLVELLKQGLSFGIREMSSAEQKEGKRVAGCRCCCVCWWRRELLENVNLMSSNIRSVFCFYTHTCADFRWTKILLTEKPPPRLVRKFPHRGQ